MNRSVAFVAVAAAFCASVLTARTTVTAYRECWGDIEVVPDELGLRAPGAVEPSTAWGAVEVGHESTHYKDGPQEIGWSSAWIVDRTSCSETMIRLPRVTPGSPALGDLTLWHDVARDVYLLATAPGPDDVVVTFRRKTNPGHTLERLGLRTANLVALVLAVTSLLFGLLHRPRDPGSQGAGPLGVAMALAAVAAILSRWA